MKNHKHLLKRETKLKETLQTIFFDSKINLHVQKGKDHLKELKKKTWESFKKYTHTHRDVTAFFRHWTSGSIGP